MRAIAPVVVGSVALNMMIDTGCSDLALTQTVADQLVASGQATYGADDEYTLADGSKHMNKTLTVKMVTIGGLRAARCPRWRERRRLNVADRLHHPQANLAQVQHRHRRWHADLWLRLKSETRSPTGGYGGP